jgi:CHAT domain
MQDNRFDKNLLSFLRLMLFGLVLSACTVSVAPVKFGAADEVAERAINRINSISTMRRSGAYRDVVNALQLDLKKFASNNYAVSRIKNELAEIYSYQLLDLELAVELDTDLSSSIASTSDPSGQFIPIATVANQKVIGDVNYVNAFIQIPSNELKLQSNARLQQNNELLRGNRLRSERSYDRAFLVNHLRSVEGDIASTLKGSEARNQILSRFVKAEFELSKIDSGYQPKSPNWFLDKSLTLSMIDLSEIDFLGLADFLSTEARRTKQALLAELALEAVYLPYTNIRNSQFRWRYNTIINNYVSQLIKFHFSSSSYVDALYFISLNKSRMLLEERLAYSSDQEKNKSVADVTFQDGVPLLKNGLPDKAWFRNQLMATKSYLDFYVDGHYQPVVESSSTKIAISSALMPLNSRNALGIVNAQASDDTEVFLDDLLYVISVSNGKIDKALALSGAGLSNLKNELEQSYLTVSNRKLVSSSPITMRLKQELRLPAQLVVSPDKWLAKYPLDFLFGFEGTRAVNFFTRVSAQNPLSKIAVAGFFNPALHVGAGDLKGAMAEASLIRASFPNLQSFSTNAASLNALRSVTSANVLHLSMHGHFSFNEPMRSKLFFAGSVLDGRTVDSNALFAEEMRSVEALRNRDLIFAAACQTGLSVASKSNESELMGILRPLTANRNRNVILSLWNVDDAATAYFVGAFYGQLKESKDVYQAFEYARAELKKKYSHPYYWAAFYLSQSN